MMAIVEFQVASPIGAYAAIWKISPTYMVKFIVGGKRGGQERGI